MASIIRFAPLSSALSVSYRSIVAWSGPSNQAVPSRNAPSQLAIPPHRLLHAGIWRPYDHNLPLEEKNGCGRLRPTDQMYLVCFIFPVAPAIKSLFPVRHYSQYPGPILLKGKTRSSSGENCPKSRHGTAYDHCKTCFALHLSLPVLSVRY